MTISTRLVDMLGGRIWLESEMGKGSSFHFTIKARIAAAKTVTVTAEPCALQEIDVLMADDNATNRLLLGRMLRQWRMRPVRAASAGEAL